MDTLNLAGYIITLQRVPQRSWKWGVRGEIRVHRPGVDPCGRGYRDRCIEIYPEVDLRYQGPRSRTGRIIQTLESRGATF